MNDDRTLYIGVIGYSEQTFDEEKAREIIEEAYEDIEQEYHNDFDEFVVVSGLTNQGIPKIAYEVADEMGYRTVGVAPEESHGMSIYDVDEIVYSGSKWGDESETFINMIDVLVKVGGGEQSEKELQMAKEEDISILEYDLDSEEMEENEEDEWD